MIIPNGYGHAALIFDLSNDEGEMVCTFGFGGGEETPAEANSTANEIFDAWEADVLPAQSSDISLTRVEVLIRSSGGQLISGQSSQAAAVGGAAFAQLPGFLSAVVRKRTNFAGRKYRGRMYVPGLLGDNDVSNGSRITAGRQTEINDALTDFGNTLVTNLDPMYLLHTAAGDPPTPVTQLIVNPVVGGLRSRRDQ